MAKKMAAALAIEGQFSNEGLAALTEGAGGSLASELAKRFIEKDVAGVENAESIWGKMTMDSFIVDSPSDEQPLRKELNYQYDGASKESKPNWTMLC
ncbi:hypothetical protein [Paenibacillus sp. 1001270B_150601_E10]|uniref:hypothetical protein n=1 Tax=Paenibacillus sp. 1001270B_150601_E10 TaxID=2787079 RepID=UPI001E58D198|nr:hypothetical protein [Paenibacillus sp. 1001270B_150601_E10]